MHNKQPFSVAKKIKLFKCMNGVKNMCWDKNMKKKYWKYVILVHENINKCTKKQENVNIYRQRKEDVTYGL